MSRIPRILILGAGAIAVASIILNSLDRTAYFYYRFQDRTKWEHPTVGVAILAGAAVLETGVAYWVFGMARPGRVWRRALLGLAVLTPWGWFLGLTVIHAPGFYIIHFLWVWLLMVSLACGAALSGGSHLYGLLRERARTNA